MPTRFLSKNSNAHATPLQLLGFDRPTIAESARSIGPSEKPNIALAGILLGCPVMMITFIALLSAGYPILEALLASYFVQVLVFCTVIIVGLRNADGSEGGIPAPGDTVYRPPEAADIWRTYPSHVETRNPVRIALIAPNARQSRTIATDLAKLGMEVHHSTDQDALLETVQAGPKGWGAVMFDVDSRADVDAVEDELLDFRATCPDIPVLFLSGAAPLTDPSPFSPTFGDMTPQKAVMG